MDFSLNMEQISKILDGKVNIISYDKVRDYKTIEDLLGVHKKCVILYLTSPTYGHYVCVWEYKGSIIFFDSYGILIDNELNFVPNHLKKELGSNHRYLTELMYNSKKPIEYNQYQLQKKANNIATCGRWCCCRLKNYTISTDEFASIFNAVKREIPLDELIVKLVPLN